MIQIKEIYCDDDEHECLKLDDYINNFLESYPKIELIDIKYSVVCGRNGNLFRSCALIIYKTEVRLEDYDEYYNED